MTTLTLAHPDEAVTAADARDAYIQGLRALAALVGSRTGVPLPNDGADTWFALNGDDAERIAQVRRVAVELGVEARWEGPHFVAELPFAGGVTYRAIAIPDAAMLVTPKAAA